MRILDRYLVRELLAPFLFGVAAFVSIFVAGNLLFRLTRLISEQGATFGEAALLFLYWLPGFVVLTFPMATLLAVLLSLSRLSSDSELIAMRAGGIPFYRLVTPLLIVAFLISLLTIAFNELLVPRASRAGQDLLLQVSTSERERQAQHLIVKEMSGENLKRLIYAERFQPGKRGYAATLEHATVIEFTRQRPAMVWSAREARWNQRTEQWEFLDGFTQTVDPKGRPVTLRIPPSGARVDLGKNPEALRNEARDPEEMTYAELGAHIVELQRQGADINELAVQLHQKLAVPFACLVFALIGAPLGLRSPRSSSSGLGLAFAVMIIFCYYLVWHYLAVVGEQGILPPALAAWLPNVLTALVGGVLIWKQSR